MRNFSSTAVPPEVNSRSSVALFMFVLSVSQWPTSDFEFFKRFRPVAGGRISNGQGAHAENDHPPEFSQSYSLIVLLENDLHIFHEIDHANCDFTALPLPILLHRQTSA